MGLTKNTILEGIKRALDGDIPKESESIDSAMGRIQERLEEMGIPEKQRSALKKSIQGELQEIKDNGEEKLPKWIVCHEGGETKECDIKVENIDKVMSGALKIANDIPDHSCKLIAQRFCNVIENLLHIEVLCVETNDRQAFNNTSDFLRYMYEGLSHFSQKGGGKYRISMSGL